MICPYCTSSEVGVINTRGYDTCNIRVRQCKKCSRIWKTIEEVYYLFVSTIVTQPKSPPKHQT